MGEAYLVDTSAGSKYIQSLLAEKAADLMDIAVEMGCLLSIVTRIELLSWITRSSELDNDIREFIAASTIDDLSEPIIQQTIKLRRHYKGLKLPDAVIAATAMVNDYTLLSTNDSDFDTIQGLRYRSLNA